MIKSLLRLTAKHSEIVQSINYIHKEFLMMDVNIVKLNNKMNKIIERLNNPHKKPKIKRKPRKITKKKKRTLWDKLFGV